MNDQVKGGGPAFPQFGLEPYGSQYQLTGGMSLRDYFAGQAMIGLSMSWGITRVDSVQFPKAAASCYEAADAMLRAREP